MNKMADTLRMSISCKPEFVRTVRLAVSSMADVAGFDVEAVEDIMVAVSEACTNIVCHGANDLNTAYEVSCEIFDDRIAISIIDQGGGYDMEQYKEPLFEEIKEGGLGIYIIKALMDEVNIDSKIGSGTHIQMIKYK